MPERATSKGGKQVPYYPIIDLATMGPRDADGLSKAEMVTLRVEDEVYLPMFTSVARFWAFVDKYFAEDDRVQPTTIPIDPFSLAEMMDAVKGTAARDSLIFNPMAVCAGQWRSVIEPIPVARYCRFMSEIRPGIRQIVRESTARFGSAPPGTPAFAQALECYRPRIEALSDSVGARVDEWWARQGQPQHRP